MPWVIFEAKVDADAYTQDVETVQGIPRPGTDRWGDPLKAANEDLWAVVESEGYTLPIPDSAVDILDSLPDFWWG